MLCLGGFIYLDTDAIINKAPDDLLHYTMFLTFEHTNSISASFIGTIPQNPFFLEILHKYSLKKWSGSPHIIRNVLEIEYPVFKINGERQTSQNVILLPPNFGIFDFGGGENYHEHFYAFNWYGNSQEGRGPYYDFHKNLF